MTRFVLITFLAVPALWTGGTLDRAPEARKDKAAVLFYGGILAEPTLVARADTANLAELALLNVRDSVTLKLADLEDRPCYGIALFTQAEWSGAQRETSNVAPSAASLRVKFYPAYRGRPAVVHDPLGRAKVYGDRVELWISLGATHVTGLPVPTQVSADVEPACIDKL